MKMVRFIPAAVALFFILSAPLSSLPICSSPEHGGLLCYCCSADGEKCPSIRCSCPGCNSTSRSETPLRWSPEMILDFDVPILYAHSVSCETLCLPAPGTAYIEVPVRPPNLV